VSFTVIFPWLRAVNNKTRKKTVMNGVASTGLQHAQSLETVSRNSSPRKKYWPAVNQVRLIYYSFFCRSASPFARSKSAVPKLQRKLKQQPFVVLYVDQVCLISKDINY
jgi:hypothetical protein